MALAGGPSRRVRARASRDFLRRATTTKKSGTKIVAMKVAASMPPTTPVPIERRAPAPAPVASISGSTPSTKASEVITIGRKRSRAALQRGLDRALALEEALLRELDDQDRVLRREADQHHQADLEVDVVLHPAHRRRSASAPSDRERHREHHRERQPPALVERGEDQEHHHDGER